MALLFGYAQLKRDNSVVDIFWGIGFCVIAVTTIILSENFSARPLIVSLLTLTWGLRLGIYIGRRNAGKGARLLETQRARLEARAYLC